MEAQVRVEAEEEEEDEFSSEIEPIGFTDGDGVEKELHPGVDSEIL